DILVVLIVGQSHGSRADLRDEAEVAIVIVLRRSPTVIKQVLMPVHATKVEIIPVQKKALVCIDPERSETNRLNEHVAGLAARRNNRMRGIDVWIGATLPEMRIGDCGLETKWNGLVGFGVDDGVENRQYASVGANDGRLNLDILGRCSAVVDVAVKRKG